MIKHTQAQLKRIASGGGYKFCGWHTSVGTAGQGGHSWGHVGERDIYTSAVEIGLRGVECKLQCILVQSWQIRLIRTFRHASLRSAICHLAADRLRQQVGSRTRTQGTIVPEIMGSP